MKTCFIIMPLTTPPDSLESYNQDAEHFRHVLECLFIPAIQASNLQPILPQVAGSDVIHGEIIKNLSAADLVLCDMSQLNANVFFEFGIRTALNKPVALVADDATANIPFDMGGFLSTEQATADDKLSLVIQMVEAMQKTLNSSRPNPGYELPDVPPTYPAAKDDVDRIAVGRARRNRPLRLGEKLLAIRKRLGFSQTEMARALQLKVYSAVANFELGTREPDLTMVLRYAKLAGVPMEFLIDDQLSLPE